MSAAPTLEDEIAHVVASHCHGLAVEDLRNWLPESVTPSKRERLVAKMIMTVVRRHVAELISPKGS